MGGHNVAADDNTRWTRSRACHARSQKHAITWPQMRKLPEMRMLLEREGLRQAVQAFQKEFAGAGYVEALPALGHGTVNGAGGELYSTLTLKEGGKALAGAGLTAYHLPEVKPHQVGALQGAGNHLRKVVFQEAVHGAGVVQEVFPQLVQPGASMVVGGHEGGYTEDIDVAALVVVYGAVHLCKDGGIGSKDVGYLDAGNVEGLGGRYAGDGVQHHGFREGGPGCVVMARVGELAVDLVRYHKNVVAEADLAHPQQFFPCPDAAHWVVGVAQKKHPGFLALFLKVLEIYAPEAVLIVKGIVQLHALVVADCREKGVVARGHDDDLVPGHRHGLYGRGISRNNPGCGDDGFPLEPAPAVPFREPAVYGLKVLVRDQLVAEDTMVQTLLEGLQYFRGGFEVHIGHPHGDGSRGAVVPLYAARAAARDNLIEVVFHSLRAF